MHARRRRTAVGATLLATIAVAWMVLAGGASDDPVAGASEPAPSAVLGAVAADGSVVEPGAAWQAGRRAPGSYEVRFADDVRLEMISWDAAATVTIRPRGAATWTVAFLADGAPVDVAFAFRAVSAGP